MSVWGKVETKAIGGRRLESILTFLSIGLVLLSVSVSEFAVSVVGGRLHFFNLVENQIVRRVCMTREGCFASSRVRRLHQVLETCLVQSLVDGRHAFLVSVVSKGDVLLVFSHMLYSLLISVPLFITEFGVVANGVAVFELASIRISLYISVPHLSLEVLSLLPLHLKVFLSV